MLFWKLGTSKELDLEQKLIWQRLGKAPAFLSFEMLFWKLGTSKELDLEQKLIWQRLGKAPKIGFCRLRSCY